MLVPDFMHEFELGVWKATLTHLIRLLYEVGNDAMQEFNARYMLYFLVILNSQLTMVRFRLVPTFGRDTIRKFSSNVSGLTKLAARDFEDILQVGDSLNNVFLWFSLIFSVQYLSLMVSFLNHTIPSSSTSCSNLLHGMPSANFACILRQCFTTSTTARPALARTFASSHTIAVLNSILMTSLVRWQLVHNAGVPRMPRQGQQAMLQARARDGNDTLSTCPPTNCMRWVTTSRPSGNLAQLTIIQLRL